MNFIFLDQLRVHSKIEQKVQSSQILSVPHTLTTSPTINILHHSSPFVTINDPTLTRQYHPASIVYFRVYSWYHAFYEFGQICNDVHHHSIIQNSFTALKVLWAPPIHPSLPTNLQEPVILLYHSLHSSAFSRMSYSWNHTVCSLFRLTSSTY